ncbi:hypothetical protein, partial [Nocardiopsis salina]|uniref:hypothetical protein n=1 Tax=Nocardiopsis salina TaxID=245836 RepID=UPI0005945881
RTDPVCHLSPDHELVTAAVEAANDPDRPRTGELVPRPDPRRPRAGTGRPPEPADGADTNGTTTTPVTEPSVTEPAETGPDRTR